MNVARLVPRCALGTCAVLALGAGAGATSASALSPWWHLGSGSRPTILQPGTEGEIVVTVANLGDQSAEGTSTPVSISDKLPSGLIEKSIKAIAGREGKAGPVSCSPSLLTCTFAGQLPPYDQIEVLIGVKVEEPQPGAVNEVSVSGGGAQSASLASPLQIGEEEPSFGIAGYELSPEEEGGEADIQAGSHPFQLTTTLTLNQTADGSPPALAKDLRFKLPPGLIGNPTPFPRCALGQFLTFLFEATNECSPQTAVGVAAVTIHEPDKAEDGFTVTAPVFNLEPAVGEPARFGFAVLGVPVFLDTSVRTGGDYGVTVSVSNASQTAAFMRSEVTFWGVPGDSRHDNARGWGCLEATRVEKPQFPCHALEADRPPPLLALPTSCPGRGQKSTVEAASWDAPASFVSFTSQAMAPIEGCNRLQFDPSIEVTPDTTAASTPMGLNVDVHVPQDLVLNATGLAESAVKDITVALPSGVAVNPSGGDGLLACSEALVGFTGLAELTPPGKTATFTPTLPEPLLQGVNFCPDAAKIGTVTIRSPLLPDPLDGAVYLAAQNANPFGSLIGLYIVAKDDQSGVLVKLAGQTQLTGSGQLIGIFENSPELPFEDAELHFFGNERAPLASPARCGSYTTNASFAPWSGTQPRLAQSHFDITTGPHGGPCPGAALPFAPSLTAGVLNIQAGSFSALTTTIGREDGEQDMQSVQLHLPPGMLGLLSTVKLCPEAQANEGTCPPDSQIGETTVSAGIGSDPVSVTGGKVYITEKYAGAPFGLSIVNPVKAGPFDLEHDTANPANQPACDCVVVRAKIEVDPHTSALTVTTDATGPHAIPHLIDGIPVQIRRVNVMVNRPSFTFNPTNCAPLGFSGTIAAYEGASQALTVPAQVTNCTTLGFAPAFKVSVSAKGKQLGAALAVKLSYPKGHFGSQANIARARVELPKQLPSRLTTLQKACVARVFDANPASCPAASVVGHARVITPVLPVPLEGPAYFVSHGGEQFPDLTIVLQGYGVTVDLIGTTFIDKRGITSTTFKSTPDVPFDTFELTLPAGKYSALTTNANLCALTRTVTSKRRVTVHSHGRTQRVVRKGKRLVATSLAMPTEFVAQNGEQLRRKTPVAVTGCAKHKRGSGKGKGHRRKRH